MAETRYAKVARDLLAGIEGGRFPLGSVLPTELELCDHYGASRHTIRTAIQELSDLGLVSRRKKFGTRVEATSPPATYRQSLGSVEDLIQFGASHTRQVQETALVTTDHLLAKTLGCAVSREWLRISSLRLVADPGAAPVGWTDVYLDTRFAALADEVRASPGLLISTLVERRYGCRIAEIRQDIEPVLLPTALAGPLQIASGTPALRIVRHYLDHAGAAFEISVTVHPAGRFRFSMSLQRSAASLDRVTS